MPSLCRFLAQDRPVTINNTQLVVFFLLNDQSGVFHEFRIIIDVMNGVSGEEPEEKDGAIPVNDLESP
jgi:uncharacterized protein (DUF779 family)